MARLSELVNQVEARLTDSPDREITTTEVGEFLMDSLRGVDKIAYVRFASVYRDFQDEQAFLNEIDTLETSLAGRDARGGGKTWWWKLVPSGRIPKPGIALCIHKLAGSVLPILC